MGVGGDLYRPRHDSSGTTYAGPSTLAGGRLGLSTSGGTALSGPQAHPRFFSGLLTHAAPAAAGLLAVADVAMSHYHQPRPGWTRDPVVTCDGGHTTLLGFAARAAQWARARGELPCVAAVAARKGTSGFLRAARHLREQLTR